MIKKTIIHLLDFDKTYPFFIDHISYGNRLSKFIVEKIDFKQGHFFTMLPENANLDRLYELKWGGMITEESLGTMEYNKKTKKWQMQYQIIVMDDEFAQVISDFLKEDPNRFVIVEDVLVSPTDSCMRRIEGTVDLAFTDSEVYYILTSETSEEAIFRYGTRNQVWQALIVFTRGSPPPSLQQLTDAQLIDIGRNATYIVTTAYDGESYVFWQKKPLLTTDKKQST